PSDPLAGVLGQVEPSQVPVGAVALRMAEKVGEDCGQLGGVAIREGSAAGTDRLPEPAAPRADDDATAGNPLQGDDAERLVVTRRDDEDPVLVEDPHQLLV